jgi:hypothetical protein
VHRIACLCLESEFESEFEYVHEMHSSEVFFFGRAQTLTESHFVSARSFAHPDVYSHVHQRSFFFGRAQQAPTESRLIVHVRIVQNIRCAAAFDAITQLLSFSLFVYSFYHTHHQVSRPGIHSTKRGRRCLSWSGKHPTPSTSTSRHSTVRCPWVCVTAGRLSAATMATPRLARRFRVSFRHALSCCHRQSSRLSRSWPASTEASASAWRRRFVTSETYDDRPDLLIFQVDLSC